MYGVPQPINQFGKLKRPTLYKRKNKSLFAYLLHQHAVATLAIASPHGLIHIVRGGRHVLERLMWLLIVIAASAIIITQGLEVWHHLQTRPSVISVERDYLSWNITFAAITICQKTIDESGAATNVMKAMAEKYNVSRAYAESYTTDVLFNNYHTYHTLEAYANGSKIDLLPPGLYIELVKNMTFRIPYWPVTQSTVKAKQGTFPLGVPGPHHFVLTEQGPCTTYNSELAIFFNATNFNITTRNNMQTDYVDVNKTAYTGSIKYGTKGFNAKVQSDLFMTPPNEIVDITNIPIKCDPGYLTEVQYNVLSVVTSHELNSLTPAARNCRFVHEADGLEHSPVYSYKLCHIECRIKLCLKYCQCTPFYYKRLDEEPICNLKGLYCLSKFKDVLIDLIDPKTKKSLCSCLQNCKDQMILIEELKNQTWFLDTELSIYFKNFPEERYRRDVLFTKTDVLVQVGGLFGLFLGCSILSLIEIPYFATLRLFWAVFGNRPIKEEV